MITFDDFKANTKEWLIGKLADMSLKEASQTISDLYDELHKPKYPKTYKECCKNYPDNEKLNIGNLLCDLEQLIICRNAYWKIAGEQMGLDKSWEPDWSNNNETKFCIYTTQNIHSFLLVLLHIIQNIHMRLLLAKVS